VNRSKIIAAALAGALAIAPATVLAGPGVVTPGKTFGLGATGAVWGIFGCSGGIIFTAVVANWMQKRALSWNEAATCGLLYWFAPPNPKAR
jgi:hypothetical protein